MGGSGFPIDLVLFGMIAAFLVLRLRSILGRRTGFERPQARPYQPVADTLGPVIDARAEPAPPAGRAVPEPASGLGQTLVRMADIDRSFTPAAFLAGAEKAFHLIVTAYAAGARDKLRPLLGADMYAAFEGAITAREAAGETQTSEIKSMPSVAIEEAALRGSIAEITVRFVSDQISLVTAKDGKPVSGTDAVTEITDLWTFERDLSQSDPAWRLTAARSA
jgi:predicted lipid-binding transport protein (Tim44 family)